MRNGYSFMRYGAFPYQTRPCPSCSSPVPSTIVYSLDPPARGVNFTVHECAICGTHVRRIVGYDIDSPTGKNDLIIEPVVSQQEIEEICIAAESSR
jgi:hypothetical protein